MSGQVNFLCAKVQSAERRYSSKETAPAEETGKSFASQIKKEYRNAVADFKQRNPEEAKTVDKQVRAGKKHIQKYGADKVSRQDMTMEEYKAFFSELMDRIPRESSQMNDTEIWSITEEGWEQMKNDLDYEAWVLGYTIENRSVHFPFQSSRVCIEKFGASIEEHIGRSFNRDTGSAEKGKNRKKDDSWWYRRHMRIKQIIQEQSAIMLSREIAAREWQNAQAEASAALMAVQNVMAAQTFAGMSAGRIAIPSGKIQAGITGGNQMRITTQMVNESARKAGIPVNNASLLDYVKQGNSQNSMLEALSSKTSAKTDSGNRKKYEKLEKEADGLGDAAKTLLQEGEKSLFTKAAESGDNQQLCDSIEALFQGYNSTVKALGNASGTLNDFYRQMLVEASENRKEELAQVGITFDKEGLASVDRDKLKAADADTLEKLFGSKSELVSRLHFLSGRISDNARAGEQSFSSGYSGSGSLYEGKAASRYDFRG